MEVHSNGGHFEKHDLREDLEDVEGTSVTAYQK
jgi:hypothetical protein